MGLTELAQKRGESELVYRVFTRLPISHAIPAHKSVRGKNNDFCFIFIQLRTNKQVSAEEIQI